MHQQSPLESPQPVLPGVRANIQLLWPEVGTVETLGSHDITAFLPLQVLLAPYPSCTKPGCPSGSGVPSSKCPWEARVCSLWGGGDWTSTPVSHGLRVCFLLSTCPDPVTRSLFVIEFYFFKGLILSQCRPPSLPHIEARVPPSSSCKLKLNPSSFQHAAIA